MTTKFLPLTLGLLLMGTPLLAANVRTITTDEAKGVTSEVPTISVWAESGLNINFIPTGETVKKVWLDDISRIGIDFDGALCATASSQSGTDNCDSEGASVIHLRQIKPINFPGLLKSKTTLLSVVTEGKDGQKELYQFRLSYGKGSPQYVSVNIVPPAALPSVIPAGSGTVPRTQRPMPPLPLLPRSPGSATDVQVQSAAPRDPQKNSSPRTPQTPIAAVAPNPPKAPSDTEVHLSLVTRGLTNAENKRLISKERRNLYLAPRVTRYVTLRRQGETLIDAAKKARITVHFISNLEQLGRP